MDDKTKALVKAGITIILSVCATLGVTQVGEVKDVLCSIESPAPVTAPVE